MSLGVPSKGASFIGSIAGAFFYVSFSVSSRAALSPSSLAELPLKEMLLLQSLLYLPLEVSGKGAPNFVLPR